MKNWIFSIIGIFLFSCGVSTDEKPRLKAAVEEYYHSLIDSDYVTFANGMVEKDSLPEDYYKQYIKLSKQFAENQQKKHGKLISATVSVIQLNEQQDSGYACLVLSFEDSVNEEVLVPMVKQDNKWFMQ